LLQWSHIVIHASIHPKYSISSFHFCLEDPLSHFVVFASIKSNFWIVEGTRRRLFGFLPRLPSCY
jgi:hypothetical protein